MDSTSLQKRADGLALRLTGEDRLLVFELCQELRDLDARLEAIARAVNRTA